MEEEPINPNVGEKRKPANEDDDKLENYNPKAKRRRKGFQHDIRLFT